MELEQRLALLEGLVGHGPSAVPGPSHIAGVDPDLFPTLLQGLGVGRQEWAGKGQDKGRLDGGRPGKMGDAAGGAGAGAFETLYGEVQEAYERQRRLEHLMAASFKLCPMQAVDLSHCCMHRLPHSLCRAWKHVRVLRLGHCQLGSLPAALRHLQVLEELSVEGNKLAYLPPVLWRLGKLRTLDASSNRIEWLSPGVTCAPALTRLDLASNALLTLPAEYARRLVGCGAAALVRYEGNSRSALPSAHAAGQGAGAGGKAVGLEHLGRALEAAQLPFTFGWGSGSAADGGHAQGVIRWREKLAFKLMEQVRRFRWV